MLWINQINSFGLPLPSDPNPTIKPCPQFQYDHLHAQLESRCKLRMEPFFYICLTGSSWGTDEDTLTVRASDPVDSGRDIATGGAVTCEIMASSPSHFDFSMTIRFDVTTGFSYKKVLQSNCYACLMDHGPCSGSTRAHRYSSPFTARPESEILVLSALISYPIWKSVHDSHGTEPVSTDLFE